MTDVTIDPRTGKQVWVLCPSCGRQPAILNSRANARMMSKESRFVNRCPQCERRVSYSALGFVKATITSKACGVHCLTAHPDGRCDCSCGGANHGKGLAA